MQQLNDELYKHYVRLGNDRAPIDKVMQEQFGVMSINNLKPEQYQQLLDAVAQLQKSAAPTPAAPNGLG